MFKYAFDYIPCSNKCFNKLAIFKFHFFQSVEVLLEKIENASNGFEVEQAGAILLEKVIDTQKSANQIRDEEIAFLLQERNEALDKVYSSECRVSFLVRRSPYVWFL